MFLIYLFELYELAATNRQKAVRIDKFDFQLKLAFVFCFSCLFYNNC